MAVDLAKLAIRVETLEAKQAAKDLDRMARSGKKAEKSTMGLSKAAKALGVALGGALVIRAVVKSFAEASVQARKFEDSISELSAITGQTGVNLAKIRKASFDFGRTTTLSATQAAEAFKLVASTQPQLLEFPDLLTKVTKSAIVLAEATGSTLPDAADTVGQSLNQFGLAAEDADRVINVLAAGAQKGASFVNETAEALKYAGTVAATVGVSFETTNAAIQQLSKVGIKASEAGTALRNIFLKLEGQTNTQFKPSIQGLEGALKNLRDSGISVTEQTELFGLRSVVAANNLINNADAVETLTGALTDQDTAYEQQKTKVDNLEGAIKALRSAQEGLDITIGDRVNPTLRDLTETLTDATNAFTDFIGPASEDDGFSKLDFAFKGMIKLVFMLGVEFTDLGDLIGSWAAQVVTALGAPVTGLKTLGIVVVSFFKQLGVQFEIAFKLFADLVDATMAFGKALKANLTLDFDLADQIMLARLETAEATKKEIEALKEKSSAIGAARSEAIGAAADEINAADERFASIGRERVARREQLDEEIDLFNSKVDFGTEANKIASEAVAIAEENIGKTREEIELQKQVEEQLARNAEIQSNQTQLDEVSDPYATTVEAAEKAAAAQLEILAAMGAESQNLTEAQERQRLETIRRVNEELAMVREEELEKEVEAEEKRTKELVRLQEERQGFIVDLKSIAAEDDIEREEIRFEEQVERLLARGEQLGINEQLIKKALENLEEQHQNKLMQIREKAGKKETQFSKWLGDTKVKQSLSTLTSLSAGLAQHSKGWFKINKAAGIANAVISTYEGVAAALKLGPPLSFVMAPIQLAAGLAQVAAIKSTTYEGGGGGTTPSLAGTTPSYNGQPVTQPSEDLLNPPDTGSNDGTENRTNVVVTGNVGFTPAIIDEIADGLREATGERDVVIFDENSRQAQDIVGVTNSGIG